MGPPWSIMSNAKTSLASHQRWHLVLASFTSLVIAYLLQRELTQAPPVAKLLGGSLVIGALANFNLNVFKQCEWAGRKLVIEDSTMKSYVHDKLLREVTIEGLSFDVSGLEPAMRDGALFRILDRSGHTFAEFGGSPALTGLRTFLREGVRLGAVLRATAIDVEELRRETHCLAQRRMAWAIPFLITGGSAFAYTLPHAGQPWAKLLNLLGSQSTLFAAGALGLAILDRFRSTESFATLAAPFELYPQDLRTRIQLEQDVWYRTCRVRSYKVLQRALFWGSWLYFVIPIILIVDPDSWRDPSVTFGVLLLTFFGVLCLAASADIRRKLYARVRLCQHGLEVEYRGKVKTYPAPPLKVTRAESLDSFGNNVDVYGQWPHSYRLDPWYLEPDPSELSESKA